MQLYKIDLTLLEEGRITAPFLEHLSNELTEGFRLSGTVGYERKCHLWAQKGAVLLNAALCTSSYEMVAGTLLVNHFQINPKNMSEGRYHGWNYHHPDAHKDEYHAWIENSKTGELIDFSSQFLKSGFDRSMDVRKNESEEWKRLKPIPKVVYSDTLDHYKICQQHGLFYRPSDGAKKRLLHVMSLSRNEQVALNEKNQRESASAPDLTF